MFVANLFFENPGIIRELPIAALILFILGIFVTRRLVHARKKVLNTRTFSLYLRFGIGVPLSLLVLLFSLAGSHRIREDILTESIEVRVAIVLDQSISMGATDIPVHTIPALKQAKLLPTRLSLCIANLQNAFYGLQGVEVVLFTFAGSTDLRTGDWMRMNARSSEFFKSLLHDIELSYRGAGTHLARVFEEAHHILKNEPSFIILCSDGGKAGSNTSLQELRKKMGLFVRGKDNERQIPVYTLGVGTEGISAPIPIFARDGSIQGFVRNPSTEMTIHTEFDPSILREISSFSFGAYMHAEDTMTGRALLRTALTSGLSKNSGVRIENPENASWVLVLVAFLLFGLCSGSFSFLRRKKRQG